MVKTKIKQNLNTFDMCAAPKNNKFAVGNSGLDKKYSNAEEMQPIIDAYFEECDNNILKIDKDGNRTTEPYTIEGLALALDISVDTLRNYEKKEGYEVFFGTIKKAKLKVQKNKVVNMLSGKSNATGSIFDLKNNHGYKDTTQTDITSKGESINKSIELPEGQNMDDFKKEIQDFLDT